MGKKLNGNRENGVDKVVDMGENLSAEAGVRKIWVDFSHHRVRNPYSIKLSVSLLLYFCIKNSFILRWLLKHC